MAGKNGAEEIRQWGIILTKVECFVKKFGAQVSVVRVNSAPQTRAASGPSGELQEEDPHAANTYSQKGLSTVTFNGSMFLNHALKNNLQSILTDFLSYKDRAEKDGHWYSDLIRDSHKKSEEMPSVTAMQEISNPNFEPRLVHFSISGTQTGVKSITTGSKRTIDEVTKSNKGLTGTPSGEQELSQNLINTSDDSACSKQNNAKKKLRFLQAKESPSGPQSVLAKHAPVMPAKVPSSPPPKRRKSVNPLVKEKPFGQSKFVSILSAPPSASLKKTSARILPVTNSSLGLVSAQPVPVSIALASSPSFTSPERTPSKDLLEEKEVSSNQRSVPSIKKPISSVRLEKIVSPSNLSEKQKPVSVILKSAPSSTQNLQVQLHAPTHVTPQRSASAATPSFAKVSGTFPKGPQSKLSTDSKPTQLLVMRVPNEVLATRKLRETIVVSQSSSVHSSKTSAVDRQLGQLLSIQPTHITKKQSSLHQTTSDKKGQKNHESPVRKFRKIQPRPSITSPLAQQHSASACSDASLVQASQEKLNTAINQRNTIVQPNTGVPEAEVLREPPSHSVSSPSPAMSSEPDCSGTTREVSTPADLRQEESTGTRYQCPFLDCTETFDSHEEKIKHAESHRRLKHPREKLSRKRFFCSQCPKAFDLIGSLRIHERTHMPFKFSCSECPKKFRFDYQLNVHMVLHQGDLRCKQCGQTFENVGLLWQHVLHRHEQRRRFPCKICGRGFPCRQSLANHQSVHTGEKPYCCDQCGLRFTRKRNFEIHYRLHTGNLPHQCDTCGRRFQTKYYLNLHGLQHKPRDQWPFQCTVCGRRFVRSGHLAKHMKIQRRCTPGSYEKRNDRTEMREPESSASHSEQNLQGSQVEPVKEWSFECVCGRRFANESDGKRHMLHCEPQSPTKQFESADGRQLFCMRCSETFTDSRARYEHLKGHRDAGLTITKREWGKFKYTCKFCKERFTSQNGQCNHLFSTHRDEWLKHKPACRLCTKSTDSTTTPPPRRRLKRKKPVETEGTSILNGLFQCKLCKVYYSTIADLSDHVKRAHWTNKTKRNRPVVCQICGMMVRGTYYMLKYHMLSHTDDRPFLCSTCGKAFSRQSYLKDHQHVHLKKQSCVCEFCGNDFEDASSMERHKNTVHYNEQKTAISNLAELNRNLEGVSFEVTINSEGICADVLTQTLRDLK